MGETTIGLAYTAKRVILTPVVEVSVRPGLRAFGDPVVGGEWRGVFRFDLTEVGPVEEATLLLTPTLNEFWSDYGTLRANPMHPKDWSDTTLTFEDVEKVEEEVRLGDPKGYGQPGVEGPTQYRYDATHLVQVMRNAAFNTLVLSAQTNPQIWVKGRDSEFPLALEIVCVG